MCYYFQSFSSQQPSVGKAFYLTQKKKTYASAFACVEINKNIYIKSWSWHPPLCQSAVSKELLMHRPCGLTGWTHSHSNPDWLEISNNSLRETNHFILRNNSLASGRRLVYYSQYHPFHLGCFHSLIFFTFKSLKNCQWYEHGTEPIWWLLGAGELLCTANQNLQKDDQELSEIRGKGQENIKTENWISWLKNNNAGIPESEIMASCSMEGTVFCQKS